MAEEILEMRGVRGVNPKERISALETATAVVVELEDNGITRFITMTPDAALRFADQIVHIAGRVKLRAES